MSISTRDILRHMELDPPLGGIFVLGSRETRVTFYSQQVRALNLIYALFAESRLKVGDSVAIIGGGVAGVTAAVGAARRGLDVTLFEQRDDVLTLQANCAKRWVHPRIYDWPADEALRADTDDLEVLTWKAGRAEDVIGDLREQWKSEVLRLNIQLVKGVRDLRLPSGNNDLKLTWNPKNGSARFKALVVAVGFGLERGLAAVPSHSYWRDDQLDQEQLDGRREFLISGVGDGGLTDLLRATIRNFRHDSFMSELRLDPRSNEAAGALSRRLMAIEGAATAQADPAQAAEIISSEYRNLEPALTNFVDTWILDRRLNRIVCLNGPGDAAFGLRASILNRFLASRVLHLGLADYWYGKIPEGGILRNGDRWVVTLDDGDTKSFDHVIVRHGTEPALTGVFPKPDLWKASERVGHRNELDQTRRPHDGWYGKAWFGAQGPAQDQAHDFESRVETIRDIVDPSMIAGVVALENRAREALSLAGYEVADEQLPGCNTSQIRVSARHGPFESRLLVRCVPDVLLVNLKLSDLLDAFQASVNTLRRDGHVEGGIFVSDLPFAVPPAGYPLLRFATPDQILRSVFDFRPYLRSLVDGFERSELARAFIRPRMAQMGVHVDIQSALGDPRFEVSRSSAGPVADMQVYCDSWLESSDANNLCLLGDYGTGKTSFCRWYAAHRARLYLSGRDTARIPLLLPLSRYTKAVDISAALTDFLVNECGIPNTRLPVFKALLEAGQFLVLLDGFDEMARYVDRHVRFQTIGDLGFFSVGRSRVVLTGRPGYFPSHEELIEVLASESSSDIYAAARGALQELVKYDLYSVEPFSRDDIDSYVRMVSDTPAIANGLLERIWSTYNLADLAGRPVLLEMMVKSLPRLMQLSQNGAINAARLYETYTGFWIDREERKGDFRKLIQRQHKQVFVRELAFQLYVQDKPSLSAAALGPKIRDFFHIEEDDKLDHFSHDIRTCSFLQRMGGRGYGFIHRSFLEYFVAEKLVASVAQDEQDNWQARSFSAEVICFVSELLSGRALKVEIERLFAWAVEPDNDILHVNASLVAVLGAGTVPVAIQESWGMPGDALRELAQMQVGISNKPTAILTWLFGAVSVSSRAFGTRRGDLDSHDDVVQDTVFGLFEHLRTKRLRRFDGVRQLIRAYTNSAFYEQERRLRREDYPRLRLEALLYDDEEQFEEDESLRLPDVAEYPDEQYAHRELLRMLRAFVAELEPEERAIVDLYSSDHRFDEMSVALNMPPSSVSRRLAGILLRLRNRFETVGISSERARRND